MKDFLPIVKLACLTAAAALIVSCGGGADYRNVLPADSFMTVSVDAASLVKKSGTCDVASNPLLDRLKAELNKGESSTPKRGMTCFRCWRIRPNRGSI